MDSYTQLHCRVSPGALPDAELPFQWLGFLASYLCALSAQADIKGLVGLLAEVMERVPLIRTGSESDPSFFLALTWDTFIILAFLFFFFPFIRIHCGHFFPSLSKSLWKEQLHFKKCLPSCNLFSSLFPDSSCALLLQQGYRGWVSPVLSREKISRWSGTVHVIFLIVPCIIKMFTRSMYLGLKIAHSALAGNYRSDQALSGTPVLIGDDRWMCCTQSIILCFFSGRLCYLCADQLESCPGLTALEGRRRGTKCFTCISVLT